MGEITLLTAKSTAKNLGKFLALGLAGLMTYGAGVGASSCYRNSQMDRKAEQVEAALVRVDLRAAQDLLTAFEKENSLRTEDAIALRRLVDTGVRDYHFWSAINNLDSETARRVLCEMKQSGAYQSVDLNKFEELVEGVTEPGLFGRIGAAWGEEKENLCVKYLEKYSSNPKSKEVRTILLASQGGSLLRHLRELGPPEGAHRKLRVFNDNWDAVSKSCGADALPKELPLEMIAKWSECIMDREQATQGSITGGVMEIGTRMKVKTGLGRGSWHSQYFSERQSIIPEGSVGCYLGVEGGRLLVRFDGTSRKSWSINWDGLEHYTSRGWNVGWYSKEELEMASPYFNEVTKKEFLQEVERLKTHARGRTPTSAEAQ